MFQAIRKGSNFYLYDVLIVIMERLNEGTYQSFDRPDYELYANQAHNVSTRRPRHRAHNGKDRSVQGTTAARPARRAISPRDKKLSGWIDCFAAMPKKLFELKRTVVGRRRKVRIYLHRLVRTVHATPHAPCLLQMMSEVEGVRMCVIFA